MQGGGIPSRKPRRLLPPRSSAYRLVTLWRVWRRGAEPGFVTRHNRPAWHIGLALASLAAAGTMLAQEPTPGNHEPTIKVQVEQVLVPVIVTDRKGHFITGLKVNDFRVFEDGVEQKLAAFYTHQNGAAELFPADTTTEPSAGGPAGLSPPSGNSLPRHTYLIALDARNSSFGNYTQVRDALKKLFQEEQRHSERPAPIAGGRAPVLRAGLRSVESSLRRQIPHH